MTMASMGINLRDSKSKNRQRKELEYVLSRSTVRYWRQERVLLSGLLIGGRFEGTNGTFN
jgi:hypothetical protein